MRAWTTFTLGGVAHVFLAVALCLPLVATAALIGVSMAAESSALFRWLLALVAVGFLALVVWASLLPPVRQVEVSTARALLDHDEVALPDIRLPRNWASRRRGAAWLGLLFGVGLVVATAILYLIPLAIGLLFLPMSDTMSWPVTGKEIDGGEGWQALWPIGAGLLALVTCLAVVRTAAHALTRLAPAMLGPTLSERVGIAVDRERRLARANAVARDLHDRLGHTLTAMTVQATAARRLLPTDPEAADRAMAVVEDLGRRAQDDVDGVVRTLRDGLQAGTEFPGVPVDLVGAVHALACESALDVDFDLPDRFTVDDRCAEDAFAVIREALTNATRHGTGTAQIRLQADEESLCIEVRNPIRGGRPSPVQRVGLSGLRERVLLRDGQITAGPEGGDSWLLTARLPVSRRVAAK